MGLTLPQVIALQPCNPFDAGSKSSDLYAGREVCELADFLAMNIRAADKMFIMLREEVTPLAKLQEIDAAIIPLLSADALDRLQRYRALPISEAHYYAQAATVYIMDFDKPKPTPTSPVTVSPLTGEETPDPEYLPPEHPDYLSAEAVEASIKETTRDRAKALLTIVEGLL